MLTSGVYDPGQRCPACGCRHWIIGSRTAECGRCSHAELLAAGARPATIMARPGSGGWRPARYELGGTRRQPKASAVIMERRLGQAWRRACFA